MPFKSTAQIGKFRELVKKGEMSQDTFDEWMKATPNPQKLPERVTPKKKPNPNHEGHAYNWRAGNLNATR